MLAVVGSMTARRPGAIRLLWVLVLLVAPLAGASPPEQQRPAPFRLLEATIDGIHGAMRAG